MSKEDFVRQYERDQALKHEAADIAKGEMSREVPRTFNGFLSMAFSDCVNARHGEPQEQEPEPEHWRCDGCGEIFNHYRFSHSRADHAPGCDGSCRNCPVEIQCGPICAVSEGK